MSLSTGVAMAVPVRAAEYFEPRWYAVYTCCRHEKQVAAQFASREIEHYLPVYESVHRWKNGRALVQLPLFPGYVFVRIALRDRVRVLQVPSVVSLVGASGMASPLSDDEVELIRRGICGGLRVEPHPYLKAGRRVRVRRGPLAGSEGILVRKKGTLRLVIALDLIMRAMAVEVDAEDVEPA